MPIDTVAVLLSEMNYLSDEVILMKSTHTLLKTALYTLLALVAFAANSVLCRLALGEGAIDALSFTVVRLLSGIIVLLVILRITVDKTSITTRGSWLSALMLFVYAITFSLAYISLDTATGALVLFAAVQITMIFINVAAGNRLHISECLGLILAFAGFAYLVLPGLTTPSLSGLVLMAASGIAWGIYTLRGRQSKYPMADTAYNFLRTTPLVIALALLAIPSMQLSSQGVMLAVLSGALASGIGYVIWYVALKGLSATEAAVVQLLVPVIAALGGMIFVSELITMRLILSGLMILGGILMVVLGRYYFVGRESAA
ncbi:MAG: DMT family transporter [Mariprofundaceae bacterium]